MKYFILVFSLFATGCKSSKTSILPNQIAEAKEDSKIGLTKSEHEALKYYFDKYFESMYQISLTDGFLTQRPIGDQDFYSIIKASVALASDGDSIAERRLFDFIDTLETQISKSKKITLDHVELFQLCNTLPINRLFQSALKYLDDYKYDNPNSTNSSSNPEYVNASMWIFIGFIPKMNEAASTKYTNLILHFIYHPPAGSNEMTATWYSWNEIYPSIENDWMNGLITFRNKVN